MTRSREVFQIDQSSTKKNKGMYFTRKHLFILLIAYILGTILATWLTHHFISKPLLENKSLEETLSVCTEILTAKDIEYFYLEEDKEKKAVVTDVRLPRSIVPNSYEIKLIPFIYENNFTFNGDIKILVNVTENTNSITLHAYDLEIDSESITIREMNGTDLSVHHVSNDTKKQFFIIHTKENLEKDHHYNISIKFTGHLSDELQGFYRSSYTVGNTKRWIATTQFEATDARRAFPCFDEPALKSKFKLFIGRPVNMTSISNMPLLRSGKPIENLPDYVWDEFEESVPMSTYLVAFVVSDFTKITDGEIFSVWARQAAIEQAKYSLEIGPKILKYFEKYFEIDFPLPKMDMIALPDFAAGAMENWGLITFRETAMLYEEGVSTRSNKERVATVVSHELAHQWFGNLVTPSWWTDLWLNEGFASYVEYLGVEAVEPSWKVMEQFVVYEVQDVFALDALKSSHQISVTVRNPDEINEIFDRISYEKGASVIRMMDHFLTTNVFKRGLSKYLMRHKYSNAEQDDLWSALTEQAHTDLVMDKNMSVKTIMDTWTLQTGYPVLTVTRDYEKNKAEISQKRFLLSKSISKSTDEKYENVLWWVPLTFTDSQELDFNNTYPSYWLRQEKAITITDLPEENVWVLFNIQETGFYRVNYDERNWKMLIDYLNDNHQYEKIGAINRAQLIDDSLNLARAELLSYDIAMNLTQYLSNELDYLPWRSAFTAFTYLDNMLIKTAGYDKFKTYVLQLMKKLYNEVGFKSHPSDSQLTIHKRINVLLWACNFGHQHCVKNSVEEFQKWRRMSNPDENNPISPDLKRVVYCTAIKAGSEDDWKFAWERFKNTNVASERDLLLIALGCSRDVSVLSWALDQSLKEGTGVRKQDIARLFSGVSLNPIGQILTFNLLTENWKKLKDYVGGSLFTIKSIVKSATKSINTESQRRQFLEFAKRYRSEFGSANRAVNQGLEQANANVRWMNRNYDSLINWLSNAVR